VKRIRGAGTKDKDGGSDLTSKTNDAWLRLRQRLKLIRVDLGWALFLCLEAPSQMQMNRVDNDGVAAGKGHSQWKGQVHGASEK